MDNNKDQLNNENQVQNIEQQQPEKNEASPAGEENKGEMLTLEDAITDIAKDRLGMFLLIMVILVLGFFGIANFMDAFNNSKTVSKEDTRAEVMEDKILYFEFFKDRLDKERAEQVENIYIGLLPDIIQQYEGLLEKNPDDEKLIAKYIILKVRSGKKKEAEEYYEKRKRLIKDQGLSTLIEKIYLSQKPQKLSADEASELAKTAKDKFSGWFRDATLIKIYEAAEEKEKVKEIKAGITEKLSSVLLGVFIAQAQQIAGLLLGPIALIILIILSVTKSKKVSLEAKGIRQSDNPLFSSLNLKKALIIYIIWEMLHTLGIFAILIKLLFGGIIAGVPLLFTAYLLLYSLIIYLIIITTKTGSLKGSLAAIGIWFGNLKAFIINLVLGISGYFAAVFSILIAIIIYYVVFKSAPVSENPVIDVISNLKSSADVVMLFLVVGVMGPIFEEVLFRGYVYTSLRRYMPAYLVVLIVSVLFAFVHYDVSVFLSLFILGAVLAIIYEKSGSLIPSIIIHMLWNSFNFIQIITLMK